MKQISDQKPKDPDLVAYFNSLDVSTEEAAKANVKTLRAISRSGLTSPYVIDIMIANGENTLGNTDVAIELMTSVLEKNPFIGGVYKDLGGMYYGRYETFLAWHCFDTARSLYPHHKMLADINQLESNLVKDAPELF